MQGAQDLQANMCFDVQTCIRLCTDAYVVHTYILTVVVCFLCVYAWRAYAYIRAYLYACMIAYMRMCMHAYVHTCVCMCIHACVFAAYVHTCMCSRLDACMHTHTYTFTHTLSLSRTHTHARTRAHKQRSAGDVWSMSQCGNERGGIQG